MYAHELFEQNKPRVVVTYPGRFQPFHQGHAGVFAQLQKKFGAENVYIATSNDQSSAKSPFNFSDKYQLMTAAGVPADRIIQTTAMYALPEGIDPANTIFITAVGAPDADRLNPDTVLKRDKKDKDGNVIKPAGSPGYYKIWDSKHDSLTADQHGYVIVIPEIKKSVTIKGQKYDVSHGTETRNLWNQIRDDDKARSEFLKQMYGKPSQELASIFDKIPQTASEDIVADNGDSTSPIRGGQIYEAGVAEDSLIEFAPVGQGPWGDDGDADPYRYPKPKSYSRSIDFFGQFEADHFDHEDFDNDTGEFKGYWGNTQIAYFKFNNPEKTGSDDPGMGWYYEPEADSNSNNASAAPAIDNSKQRKQQELGMIDAFLKSGQTPKPGSQIYSLMKRHGLVEDSETKSLDPATVRRIQNYLNKKFNANLDVDGIMGELTLKSIRKFIPSSAKKLAPSPERNTAVQGSAIKKEEQLDEACWKGYHKEGNKKMFGKTYPNCVKNTNEEQGVAKGATVTRIDSKPITDFASGLKAYKHTDDWSQSGVDTGDDRYWKNKNLKTSTTKGLFAGDPRRTALYATGNAHETRYVEFTLDGQPIVYFDKKDLPAMRSRKTYLTVFDADNFKQLPTGEWFSENPGKPIKQMPIGDPFKYIADQGWIVRVTDDLDKVFKQVKKMYQAGKIAQYGAEGMNESKHGVAEGLDEAVGGNYLYHATGANGLSSILQSGYIKSADGPQKATQAQTALPTVSVTRDWGYASGSNAQSQDGGIGRDAILILDRNALESNYKTISTSQSRDIRGMPRASEPGLSGALTVRKAVVKPGVELKGQHKMSYGTAKAGGEFEEAVVVPKGVLPLKGTMVGFWVNPNSELMKDPTIMNDPRRLDMVRPNQFVKAKQTQGVAEGSTGISVRKWANQVRKDHGADVKFWNRREGGGAVDSVVARNSQGETVGVYNRKTGYPTVFEPKQELEEKWSKKYKDSINCSNPKGFSQKAHCAGKNEDTQQDSDQLDENLKKWFKEKWVRFGPDGKIRGACARGDSSEGKPKCLPQSKAHSLGKKGRASAAAKKRREDPNPERRGSAINVATKTKANEGASGVIATKKQARDPRYSMSLTKDVRPGQIEKSLRAFKLAEGKNSNAEMFELFAKFLPLAMKDLGLTTLPKIVPELHIKSHDGQATFGRFVNDQMSIHLALANRHPVDILRTLAHELVHFKQLTLGKIKDTSGITGSPEENQANTIAGIIMRHFNKEYPNAVNMQPIELDESLVTVNYGIGKNPGKLAKVGPGGRVPHAKLHVNVDKKTAKKLGIPHLNENGDDEADEVKKQKNLIPFPKGTVKVDVSDVYDWYKLGMEISDLDDADPADFGKGPPQTVMAFGDEEQEHKYLPQLQRLGLKTHDIDEAAQKCPPATQDITLNLENRQKAIDEYGYGPLNPDMPNRKFWMKKVDEWNLDSMEEAQQSLCGNCAAFDIRQETLDCIAQGIDSDNPQDAEGVIDAGDLGYCKFLKFKCASRRTCDAWVTGGPLQDKPIDENFADGRNPGDKGSLKAKVKGKVTMGKARAILKNKNSTPRAKQLAHWFINMNKGRNK